MCRTFRILSFTILLGGIFVVSNYFLSRDDSKIAIKIETKSTSSENISTIIIPHFDFFKDKRQEFLKKIAQKSQPKQILVVSVNHFNVGQGNIIVTGKNWDFTGLKTKVNTKLFKQLVNDKVATSEDGPFAEEHGIYNVLPDLVKNFPNAEFLPVIIKDRTSKNEVNTLYDDVIQNCPDCMITASVDFSHYNPNSLAQIHDANIISALSSLNEGKVWGAETDSPQTLYLATKWAKQANQKFDFFYNDNSGNIQKSDDSETTSTIIGSFRNNPNNQVSEKVSTFLIGGDMMFDREVYHAFKDQGLQHIFDNFGLRVFWGSDLALANLEGPISDKPIVDDTSVNNLNFNFPPETADILKFANIKQVSLANNHTLNAGASGFETTKKKLEQANIQYAGSQQNFDASNVLRIDSEIPLSVVALDQLVSLDQVKIKAQIKKEKAESRFVIMFPHWGTEYETKHNANQSNLAKEWIDAGADAVVGSHPHMVQDFEIYKGKPIVYSLGNFVFDQDFSKETQEGLLVGGIIRDDKLTLSFFPLKSVKMQPSLMRGEEKVSKINKILDINSNAGFLKVRNDTIEISLSDK